MSLFIYFPIYVVEADQPNWVAGGMLSFVSGLLLASTLVRRLADRFGTRTITINGLLLTALRIFYAFYRWSVQTGRIAVLGYCGDWWCHARCVRKYSIRGYGLASLADQNDDDIFDLAGNISIADTVKCQPRFTIAIWCCR